MNYLISFSFYFFFEDYYFSYHFFIDLTNKKYNLYYLNKIVNYYTCFKIFLTASLKLKE